MPRKKNAGTEQVHADVMDLPQEKLAEVVQITGEGAVTVDAETLGALLGPDQPVALDAEAVLVGPDPERVDVPSSLPTVEESLAQVAQFNDRYVAKLTMSRSERRRLGWK